MQARNVGNVESLTLDRTDSATAGEMPLSAGNMGPPLVVRTTQDKLCCPEDRKAKLIMLVE